MARPQPLPPDDRASTARDVLVVRGGTAEWRPDRLAGEEPMAIRVAGPRQARDLVVPCSVGREGQMGTPAGARGQPTARSTRHARRVTHRLGAPGTSMSIHILPA
jgi:hypothetical protein